MRKQLFDGFGLEQTHSKVFYLGQWQCIQALMNPGGHHPDRFLSRSWTIFISPCLIPS